VIFRRADMLDQVAGLRVGIEFLRRPDGRRKEEFQGYLKSRPKHYQLERRWKSHRFWELSSVGLIQQQYTMHFRRSS